MEGGGERTSPWGVQYVSGLERPHVEDALRRWARPRRRSPAGG